MCNGCTVHANTNALANFFFCFGIRNLYFSCILSYLLQFCRHKSCFSFRNSLHHYACNKKSKKTKLSYSYIPANAASFCSLLFAYCSACTDRKFAFSSLHFFYWNGSNRFNAFDSPHTLDAHNYCFESSCK